MDSPSDLTVYLDVPSPTIDVRVGNKKLHIQDVYMYVHMHMYRCGSRLVHEALVCKWSLWVVAHHATLLSTHTRFQTSLL